MHVHVHVHACRGAGWVGEGAGVRVCCIVNYQ